MPNWVFNSLVVSGEKSELERMVAHLNQPFTKDFPRHEFNDETKTWEEVRSVQVYDNPVFAFWNIVRPSDLEKYYGEEVYKNNDGLFDDENGKMNAEKFMKEFVRAMEEDEDWYHWNCRNWGTKWDVAVDNEDRYPETTMEWTDNDEVMYRFHTAWSPVEPAITLLSEMFPSLEFDYEYEEEQGWGGTACVINGDYVQTADWGIPESHADYKALDRECSCEYGDIDYAYADCPLTDTHTWDEDQESWVEKTLDTALSDSVK